MNLSPETKTEVPETVARETLLHRITDKIRISLELSEILTTAVTEVSSFLGTDRVMIYKFHADSSGQVIAEFINNGKLPSLVGLNFPADDIPSYAREMFVKLKVCSIVNVETQQIGESPARNWKTGEILYDDIYYRRLDPCHMEYLTAMGVNASLVTPIVHQDVLWGLLVSHHSTARSFSKYELEVMQIVVDQLAVAIAQSNLLTQAREKAKREAIINQISTLLHSLPTVALQPALEGAVAAFGGSGGRLCIRNHAFNFEDGNFQTLAECLEDFENHIDIYTYGQQPVIPPLAKYPLMEQYQLWQEHYKSGKYDIWVVPDVYQVPEFRTLQAAFRLTKIRGMLMIPLKYREQLLGYLSIFRDEVDTETLWAGKFDTDERQLYPRISFEAWRESKTAQTRPWTAQEIELAGELGRQFASAVQQYELYQQVQTFNSYLEEQVKERTSQLQQALRNLQQTQTQLIQNEKMSSLGQLVAGIAHEINNPVNFIYGNIRHISYYTENLLKMLKLYQQERPDLSPEILELAQEIDLDFLIVDLPKILSSMEFGSDRIRKIVLSLRNFSRLDEADMKAVDIHEGIESTLMILQHRWKGKTENTGIKVIKQYGEIPQVECYAGQLNQVFMHILNNAIDALETKKEFSPNPEISQITIHTQLGKLHGTIPSVVIKIADNGLGIPQDAIAHIFDPFFTTKPVGKGTGLGLSISYQIVVQKHGGILECNSHSETGTEFWIEIPMRQSKNQQKHRE